MAITKILYIILLVISAIFYILYMKPLSSYILIFIVLIPLFLGICTLCAKFFISGSIQPQSDTVIKNNKINLTLNIKNKTLLPFSSNVITIEYFNNLMNVSDKMTIAIPIHPLCNEKINFSLTSDYCGILNIRIKSIHVFDFIKLFSVRIKPQKTYQITVLPEIHPLISTKLLTKINSEDSDKFSKHKSGDDPSEIFALKDYVQGDKQNRIHWNLSLKYDDLIVRHYSQPISSSILVLLDFCGSASKKHIQSLDTVAETAFSISAFLTENEIPFKFAYFNSKLGHEEIISISDISGITDALESVFINNPVEKTNFDKTLLDTAYSYSKIFYITPSADNLSRIFDKINYENLTPILIKNEYDEKKYEFQNSNELIIIPAGKAGEIISNILI